MIKCDNCLQLKLEGFMECECHNYDDIECKQCEVKDEK